MPTRRLPARPNLQHLKHQARDLLSAWRAHEPSALQRAREFHPRFVRPGGGEIDPETLSLGDAHLALAREYGFRSWVRLRTFVQAGRVSDLDRPHHERIRDATFRRAVDLLDDGDEEGLRDHLTRHPGVVHQRVVFEGENYFSEPTLLEFVAENPIRHDHLPPNIVDIARLILDAGAQSNALAIGTTLSLVCSGRVAREWGAQEPLIDLLCAHGADPDGAMDAAVAHGEFGAAGALVRHGAKPDLAAAAALGRFEDARRLLPDTDSARRHRALALAAQFGNAGIVRLLLDAGEDPARYNPVGAHAHSTPLHQAALAGHLDVVELLVERGAKLDRRDIHHGGTPADWAEHGGHPEIAAALRSRR